MAKQMKIMTGVLLLVALAVTCVSSARILDEDQPAPSESPIPEAPPATSPEEPSPVAGTATAPTAATVTNAAGPAPDTDHDPHHALTLYMHDVLGGSHASARVVTGIVASSDVNGALPFAKANGGVFPISGGTALPNGIINNNNVPFLTGLGAQTNPNIINNGGGNNILGGGNNNILGGGNNLPFVAGGQLPTGTTLQQLLFGTMTVIDDELTEGHELGSAVVGKAQGFYVASSEDGSSQTMAFTAALLESGHYVADTISFFGVHRRVSDESHIAVIGGSGKYANAQGYATVKTVHQEDQHTTDGVDTVLELNVYLS